MAIREKKEKNILSIIEKGGKAKMENTSKKRKALLLKVPESLISKVDMKVEEREIINRTDWILEAIQEKLKREE